LIAVERLEAWSGSAATRQGWARGNTVHWLPLGLILMVMFQFLFANLSSNRCAKTLDLNSLGLGFVANQARWEQKRWEILLDYEPELASPRVKRRYCSTSLELGPCIVASLLGCPLKSMSLSEFIWTTSMSVHLSLNCVTDIP
jgi:hypothetical protein